MQEVLNCQVAGRPGAARFIRSCKTSPTVERCRKLRDKSGRRKRDEPGRRGRPRSIWPRGDLQAESPFQHPCPPRRASHLSFVGRPRRGARFRRSLPNDREFVVAVSPWEPHNFVPRDLDDGSTFFVLYVNPDWFAPGVGETLLRFGRSEFARTPALDAQIRRVSALVYAGQRVATLDCELRSLISGLLRGELASKGRWREPVSNSSH